MIAMASSSMLFASPSEQVLEDIDWGRLRPERMEAEAFALLIDVLGCLSKASLQCLMPDAREGRTGWRHRHPSGVTATAKLGDATDAPTLKFLIVLP